VAVDHCDVMSVGVGVDPAVDRAAFVYRQGTAPFAVSGAQPGGPPVDTSREGKPPRGDVIRAVCQPRPPGHRGPGGRTATSLKESNQPIYPSIVTSRQRRHRPRPTRRLRCRHQRTRALRGPAALPLIVV
jgi:hypothetical protein